MDEFFSFQSISTPIDVLLAINLSTAMNAVILISLELPLWRVLETQMPEVIRNRSYLIQRVVAYHAWYMVYLRE